MSTLGIVGSARAETVLSRAAWETRATRHRDRVAAWTEPHLARRAAGESHPVEDFLFTYYSQRPGALSRWHPGFGVALTNAPEYAEVTGYDVDDDGTARVGRRRLLDRSRLLAATLELLTATSARPAHFGCFGLHEWAMVYRLGAEDVRHAAWPLRLGREGTDRVVEEHRIGCSHFDAYRFFTPAAVGLNVLSPSRADRPSFEQPGCLHANMDLYKHAYRLTPLVASELVADCFELAREIRVLDMRAAPYDLRGLGLDPICIETPAGKAEYAAAQRGFSARAQVLRAQLRGVCEVLSRALNRLSAP